MVLKITRPLLKFQCGWGREEHRETGDEFAPGFLPPKCDLKRFRGA
jgi:hypothetical protein